MKLRIHPQVIDLAPNDLMGELEIVLLKFIQLKDKDGKYFGPGVVDIDWEKD